MKNVSLSTDYQFFISYKRDEKTQQKRVDEALSKFQALVAEGLSTKDMVRKPTVCSNTHVDISKIR